MEPTLALSTILPTPTSRTILIVDDFSEDRELYRRYLLRDREYDYKILQAASGQQGLELWQQHQPDAILLDYRLPDLDGLEFLAQLKSHPQQSCLPVIMVTGYGNETIAVQAMKAGAQDYLVKGQITPERLHLAVNGVIETVQLHIQLQQLIEREQLVWQITQEIHQSLALEEILQTTVDGVRQFLQTDRVVIFRLESEGWGKVVTESIAAEWTPLLSTSLHDSCLDENYFESFRQGLVTVKSDIDDGSIEPCHAELLRKLQVRANLVVPILQDKQLWGMLIAHQCSSPRQWESLEIDLLKELATQVGIALWQAELYQQNRRELAKRRQAEAEREMLYERQAQALEEQVRAEVEKRQESEQKFRAIFDQTYQFIGLLKPDGTLIEANQTVLDFSGLTLADVIGKPFWETPWWSHSTEEQERLQAAIAKAAQGGIYSF